MRDLSGGPLPQAGEVMFTEPEEEGEGERAWSEHLHDALKEVRSAAPRMSKAEIRARLAAELLARGEMPPARVIDYYSRDVALGNGPYGTALRVGKKTVEAAWAMGLGVRSLGAAASGRAMPHWHIMGIHWVVPDKLGPRFDVTLRAGSGRWLAVGERDAIEVWLKMEKPQGKSENQEVMVYRGDEPLGLLGDDGVSAYREVLLESSRKDVVVAATGIRGRFPDGSWRLRVCSPRSANIRS
jgi:hypothetical protein